MYYAIPFGNSLSFMIRKYFLKIMVIDNYRKSFVNIAKYEERRLNFLIS